MQPHWEFDRYTHQRDGALDTFYQGFHQNFNFQDGSNAEVGVNVNQENVLVPFAINSARGAHVPPGRYDFAEYFAFWNTDASATLSFNSRFSMGEFYGGYRRGYTFGPALRLNENLNAALNVQVQDITLPSAAFVSTLVTARVNYNFNRRTFLNA